MATELRNSVFVHIPKTGSRWVAQQLYLIGGKPMGDPVYDAHACPDTDKPVFAYVRHPITMLNSLWHHRARKHSNKRHKEWNWQQDHRLEAECGCPDYVEFFKRVSERPGIVWEYYMEFVGKYDQLTLLRYENLARDLISALDKFEEGYDPNMILAHEKNIIGGANAPLRIMDEAPYLAHRIIANEPQLYNRFGYNDWALKLGSEK